MSKPARALESVAVDVLRCALAWQPDARLVGDVTALDVARLAASAITACPKCGSEPWVNIDCNLCRVVGALEDEGEA